MYVRKKRIFLRKSFYFFYFNSEWTEGPRNKVQPDQVEQDVGNYERQLFKLERQFNNNPQPRKMANRLRVQVGEFKEKMPLIQTLFNPGLRDRHWEQVSAIIGQPFKPDDDTNLNKIIEMDLMQHIPKLEQISEAASKEFSLEKAMEKMKKDWQNVNPLIFIILMKISLFSFRLNFQLYLIVKLELMFYLLLMIFNYYLMIISLKHKQ